MSGLCQKRDPEDLRISAGCFGASNAGWETAKDGSTSQLKEDQSSGKQSMAAQHMRCQGESSDCYTAGLGIRAAFQIK